MASYRYCGGCSKNLEDDTHAIGCDFCHDPNIRYCSEECRSTVGWVFHSRECDNVVNVDNVSALASVAYAWQNTCSRWDKEEDLPEFPVYMVRHRLDDRKTQQTVLPAIAERRATPEGSERNVKDHTFKLKINGEAIDKTFRAPLAMISEHSSNVAAQTLAQTRIMTPLARTYWVGNKALPKGTTVKLRENAVNTFVLTRDDGKDRVVNVHLVRNPIEHFALQLGDQLSHSLKHFYDEQLKTKGISSSLQVGTFYGVNEETGDTVTFTVDSEMNLVDFEFAARSNMIPIKLQRQVFETTMQDNNHRDIQALIMALQHTANTERQMNVLARHYSHLRKDEEHGSELAEDVSHLVEVRTAISEGFQTLADAEPIGALTSDQWLKKMERQNIDEIRTDLKRYAYRMLQLVHDEDMLRQEETERRGKGFRRKAAQARAYAAQKRRESYQKEMREFIMALQRRANFGQGAFQSQFDELIKQAWDVHNGRIEEWYPRAQYPDMWNLKDPVGLKKNRKWRFGRANEKLGIPFEVPAASPIGGVLVVNPANKNEVYYLDQPQIKTTDTLKEAVKKVTGKDVINSFDRFEVVNFTQQQRDALFYEIVDPNADKLEMKKPSSKTKYPLKPALNVVMKQIIFGRKSPVPTKEKQKEEEEEEEEEMIPAVISESKMTLEAAKALLLRDLGKANDETTLSDIIENIPNYEQSAWNNFEKTQYQNYAIDISTAAEYMLALAKYTRTLYSSAMSEGVAKKKLMSIHDHYADFKMDDSIRNLVEKFHDKAAKTFREVYTKAPEMTEVTLKKTTEVPEEPEKEYWVYKKAKGAAAATKDFLVAMFSVDDPDFGKQDDPDVEEIREDVKEIEDDTGLKEKTFRDVIKQYGAYLRGFDPRTLVDRVKATITKSMSEEQKREAIQHVILDLAREARRPKLYSETPGYKPALDPTRPQGKRNFFYGYEEEPEEEEEIDEEFILDTIAMTFPESIATEDHFDELQTPALLSDYPQFVTEVRQEYFSDDIGDAFEDARKNAMSTLRKERKVLRGQRKVLNKEIAALNKKLRAERAALSRYRAGKRKEKAGKRQMERGKSRAKRGKEAQEKQEQRFTSAADELMLDTIVMAFPEKIAYQDHFDELETSAILSEYPEFVTRIRDAFEDQHKKQMRIYDKEITALKEGKRALDKDMKEFKRKREKEREAIVEHRRARRSKERAERQARRAASRQQKQEKKFAKASSVYHYDESDYGTNSYY